MPTEKIRAQKDPTEILFLRLRAAGKRRNQGKEPVRKNAISGFLFTSASITKCLQTGSEPASPCGAGSRKEKYE
jgi:hypothetical protein